MPERAVWEYRVKGPRLREEGLCFFDTYPRDPRRWLWLLMTLNAPPRIYADSAQAIAMWEAQTEWLIVVDTVAQRRIDDIWRARYPRMRAGFMASPLVTDDNRRELLFQEMWEALMDARNALRRGEPIHNLGILADTFLREADTHAMWHPETLAWVFTDPMLRIFDPKTTRAFIARATKSQDSALRRWAKGTERVLYTDTIFRLRGKSATNVPIDIADYRGQIVVVDTWGTGCSGCIEAFARLRRLYAKYHHRGVQFIGLVIDDEDRRQQVIQLTIKRAVPWPQIFTGNGRLWYEARYGIATLGVYFIVDRQGQLITMATGLNEQELDRVLDMATSPVGSRPKRPA